MSDGKAVRIREYYHDGRNSKQQLTDEEYCDAIKNLAEDLDIKRIIVDPSASSFIAALRRRGWHVQQANNDVLNGISCTAALLKSGTVVLHSSCKDALREFGLYSWDAKSTTDRVIKENDHAMDDIRYFCYTVMRKEKADTGREYQSLWAAR